MSSGNLSIVDRDGLDDSSDVLSNKETQTSTIYITDSFELNKGPSRPLPKGIDKSDIEGPILDRKVIKDPSDSRTTAFTETFIKDIVNTNLSISDSGESRNRYCEEVVIPYLKPHSNDCEDNESLESLRQDGLEDLPDYQPCFEVYEGKKDIEEKTSKSKIDKMDAQPSSESPKKNESLSNIKTSVLHNQTKLTTKSHSKLNNINKPSKTIVKPACPDDIQLPSDVDAETNKKKEIHNSLSRESINKCVKKSLTALKQTASSCYEKIEIVMGIKKPENPDEKPTYYPMEKKKVECSASHNVQTEISNSLNNIKNLFNNHNEKITTIKETVKDLSGKFYKTSKDAVTYITSESAKLLNKKRAEVQNADNLSTNQPKKVKNLETSRANSITNFLLQKAENKPIKDEVPKQEAIRGPPETTTSSLAIASSAIGSQMRKIRDDMVTAKLEKSSPYDDPVPKEVARKAPDQSESRMPTVSAIDHTPDPPSTYNMFSLIKSKIFSMFQDENEIPEPVIQESQPDDEDEDPFERFMEQ